jgi:MMPL family
MQLRLFRIGSSCARHPLAVLAVWLVVASLVSHAGSVPDVAPTLGTIIGLGVGIDYPLFLITRYHEARRAGIDVAGAVGMAQRTVGAAVLFAGSTVVIALLSLTVAGIAPVTGLGHSSAVVVAVAMLAATTLLPALLGFAGTLIDALPVRAHTTAEARSSDADVRDPLRPLDGLRGVPAEPHPGAPRPRRAPGGRGRARARRHRPPHHRRGPDHGDRLRRLRLDRRSAGQDGWHGGTPVMPPGGRPPARAPGRAGIPQAAGRSRRTTRR